ncbi:MAG: phage Gp37/Gp68 family protein [Acidobacteriota bacterium]|nr:phage Gp37/Gp68 family protein [Acidobacteriota bacterium]
MATNTSIEWTDATWNPIRGCSRVSEGCRHCYAEAVAARFSGAGQAYEGLAELKIIGQGTPAEHTAPHWTGRVRLVPEHLADPIRWKKPRRIFVNSMSDLFHEKLPFETIAKVFAVMALSPQHTFQVLTKRPQRMLEFFTWARDIAWPKLFPWDVPDYGVEANVVLQFLSDAEAGIAVSKDEDPPAWPLPNVWLGVSVEDQESADARIPLLLNMPAAVRWISAEPLLGPIILKERDQPEVNVDWLRGFDGGEPAIPGLDWVVGGGESGPGARPMHPAWALALRDQCRAAKVAFFFKQWGAWQPIEYRQGRKPYLKISVPMPSTMKPSTREIVFHAGEPAFAVNMLRVGKHAAGRLLDGREWNQYPEARA